MPLSIRPAHRCRHCQRIVLRREHFALGDCDVELPHTATEICGAIKDGCALFRLLFLEQTRLGWTVSLLGRNVIELRAPRLRPPTRIAPLRFELCDGDVSLGILTMPQLPGSPECYSRLQFRYKKRILDTPVQGFLLKSSLGPAADELRGQIGMADNPYVGSASSMCKAREWLSTCHMTHAQCAQTQDGFAPSRLLKIVRTGSHLTVCLVNTSPEQRIKWAALSYVWGGDQAYKCTLTSLAVMRRPFPVHELPLTISNGIDVCEQLGLEYIWVDSLCIIQDNEEDLERELAVMPMIYQQAWVTISASSASNCSEGFLHPRTYSSMFGRPVALRYLTIDGMRTGTIVLAESRYSSGLELLDFNIPIQRRAWTFQEQKLSTRLLDFGNHFLAFNCRTGRICESTGWTNWSRPRKEIWSPIAPCYNLYFTGLDLIPWHWVVRDYVARVLTYPEDKLTAIGALADLYQKERRHTYVAGLWKETLIDDLCWMVYRGDNAKKGPLLSRPYHYRAPSWSWAAVDVWPNTFFFADHDGTRTLHHAPPGSQMKFIRKARLVDVVIDQKLPATTYGRITGGHVILEGLAFETTCDLDDSALESGLRVCRDALEHEWPTTELATDIHVTLFVMKVGIKIDLFNACPGTPGMIFGLVLLPLKSHRYRRIGAFEWLLSETRRIAPAGPEDRYPAEFERRVVKIV